MFFEAPEGQRNCFRFVFDPSEVELDKSNLDVGDDDGFRFAGTVVVPMKTKKGVEKFIAKTLKINDIEIQLGIDIGSCIENELNKLHENQACSLHCKCNFETERYWGHHIYHLILDAYASSKNIEKDIVINPYNYDLADKPTKYLENNEWHDNKKIGPFEGSVDFVLSAILNSYNLEHFKIGSVNEIGLSQLQEENPFENCKKGNCKYNCGKPLQIWKSESLTKIPDPNYRPIRGWAPHKLQEGRQPKMITETMAYIEKLNCICSSKKYYYRLVKNELYAKKTVDKNDKDAWVNHHYTNRYLDEKTRDDDKIIHELLCIFYENVIPTKQANIAAKIILEQLIEGNKERNSKFLLRKQLKKMEKVVNYWPDLERLRGKLKEVKN